MKNLIKFYLLIMILVPFSCNKDSLNGASDGIESFNKSANNKSTVDVFSPFLGDVLGSSILHRSKNGITVNFQTSGLIPGNAYTLWWVIWNKPENCAVPGACLEPDFGNAANIKIDVLYATGHIVGNSGIGNFSTELKVGDISGSLGAFGPSYGLMDPQKAEVHLVLRSHGPAQPGMIDDQIHTISGGCNPVYSPPGFGPDPNISGACRDIQAAIHPPN